ncbi:hypothetical protein Pst134EA_027827 [Puccinia striiformis f. sp. tritici]|uniref:hypothetical protein n=1 Tax=Puccinia striiformis f. sp. tritici TaxID=168172 RepID=UPI00200836C6|nr:hypothetical protein Pst134EA_027827 [Puccinia striiformis f. sp. tritici]KAH9448516.1 hypothetical protein Pst134EA_027827 [Puccinia striiformis f. sp. tritici]
MAIIKAHIKHTVGMDHPYSGLYFFYASSSMKTGISASHPRVPTHEHLAGSKFAGSCPTTESQSELSPSHHTEVEIRSMCHPPYLVLEVILNNYWATNTYMYIHFPI